MKHFHVAREVVARMHGQGYDKIADCAATAARGETAREYDEYLKDVTAKLRTAAKEIEAGTERGNQIAGRILNEVIRELEVN